MDNEKIIILTVLAGSLFAFLLIVVIILFVVIYQRKSIQKRKEYALVLKNKELELLRTVIQTQENERLKIAGNLHDEIHPLLAALKLMVIKHEKDLDKGKLHVESLQQEKELINGIVENLQTTTRDLSPRILHKYGLIRALNSYFDSVSDFKINFTAINEDKVELPENVSLNVYRMILEFIQNIRKHENAHYLEVFLSIQKEILVIKIEHDGLGISNEDFVHLIDNSEGIGLNSIQARLSFLQAKLDFQKFPVAQIYLSVPLIYHAQKN